MINSKDDFTLLNIKHFIHFFYSHNRVEQKVQKKSTLMHDVLISVKAYIGCVCVCVFLTNMLYTFFCTMDRNMKLPDNPK